MMSTWGWGQSCKFAELSEPSELSELSCQLSSRSAQLFRKGSQLSSAQLRFFKNWLSSAERAERADWADFRWLSKKWRGYFAKTLPIGWDSRTIQISRIWLADFLSRSEKWVTFRRNKRKTKKWSVQVRAVQRTFLLCARPRLFMSSQPAPKN